MESMIWYEEELLPPDNLQEITRGAKDPTLISELSKCKIRIYRPQERIIGPSEKLAFRRPEHNYILIKLGCEFDPGEKAREARFGFLSAKITVFLLGQENLHPRVYDLYPAVIDQGKPDTVKLKLEPSFTLVSGAGGSLGGIETDISVGQIDPVVRGFKGEEERCPYWNLQHFRTAPLYGVRQFWLVVEVPEKLETFRVIPLVEAKMQSKFGPIPLSARIQQQSMRKQYVVKCK
jgi:hypothetical protein